MNAHSLSQLEYQPSQMIFAESQLIWRQRKLIVGNNADDCSQLLLTGRNQDWLVSCLGRSPLTSVKLDLTLGEIQLESWADACLRANKPAFLQLQQLPNASHKKLTGGRQMRRRSHHNFSDRGIRAS